MGNASQRRNQSIFHGGLREVSKERWYLDRILRAKWGFTRKRREISISEAELVFV